MCNSILKYFLTISYGQGTLLCSLGNAKNGQDRKHGQVGGIRMCTDTHNTRQCGKCFERIKNDTCCHTEERIYIWGLTREGFMKEEILALKLRFIS